MSVASTNDGGHLLVGFSDSVLGWEKSQTARGQKDMWIVRIDSNGTKLWDKTFGGGANDQCNDVVQTTDGGYLLAGYSGSGISGDKTAGNRGDQDYWVVKIDQNGTKLWDKAYGGSGTDALTSILPTKDGSFLLGGKSDSNVSSEKTENSRGSFDYWVVKIDANGTKLWDKAFGGEENEALGSDIVTAAGGGYMLAGSSDSGINGDRTENNRGMLDLWVVRIDENGTKLWDKRYGGNRNEWLGNILSIPEGGYLLSANTESSSQNGDVEDPAKGSSDAWLVRLADDGSKLWDRRLGGDGWDWVANSTLTDDGGFLVTSASYSGPTGDKSNSNRGGHDIWAIKLDANGNRNHYASDPEGDNFTWSISGGGDASYFEINATNGNYICRSGLREPTGC